MLLQVPVNELIRVDTCGSGLGRAVVIAKEMLDSNILF